MLKSLTCAPAHISNKKNLKVLEIRHFVKLKKTIFRNFGWNIWNLLNASYDTSWYWRRHFPFRRKFFRNGKFRQVTHACISSPLRRRNIGFIPDQGWSSRMAAFTLFRYSERTKDMHTNMSLYLHDPSNPTWRRWNSLRLKSTNLHDCGYLPFKLFHTMAHEGRSSTIAIVWMRRLCVVVHDCG